MNKYHIKTKLIWLGAMIFFGMVSLVFVSSLLVSIEAKIYETMRLVKASESDILTLRKHEKDFLARNNEKYVDKFSQHFLILEQNLSNLKESLISLELSDDDDLNSLNNLVGLYGASFHNLVELKRKVGLSHKLGLRGALRKAVHDAESLINGVNSHSLLADMLMLRRNEKDFMLRKDLKYRDKFEKNYKVLITTLNNESISSREASKIESKMEAYRTMFLEFVTNYERMGLKPNLGLEGEMRSAIHQTQTEFTRINDALAIKATEQLSANEKRIFLVVLVVIGLVIGLLVAITRSINSRLNEFKFHMSEVALGSGDLTATLNIKGEDEITEISVLFNQFVSNLHKTFIQIPDFTKSLQKESEHNADLSYQTNQLSIEQEKETQFAEESIRQIVEATENIARDIHIAASSAKNANLTADSGKQEIQLVSDEMNQLSQELQSSIAMTKDLEDNSNNIGVVIEVIRGIAEQTNLLALNAAIEAARAGENGRGFAVVADEVRTLAQRTQTSTQEIQALIEALQVNVKNTIVVMNQGSSKATLAAENTMNALATLDNITGAVHEIFELNDTISTAAEEQTAVSSTISQNIMKISNESKVILQLSNEASLSSAEIKDISSKIQNLIASYKL